ncbi:Lon protease [uncultured Desulfatiglans sp.]|uniref:Lon protease n=1 Tax=Uncultured Desulfatiglans sp. TaxID=1748965 RepID=A0A653AI38_UNCDX|nr:Lon protease [uncultured Desulfatiglans sp.]
MDFSDKKIPDALPVLPLKDAVIFPRMVVPLAIREEAHRRLVDDALHGDKMVLTVMMKDGAEGETTGTPEVHRIGTACHIMKLSKMDEGTVVVVQGIARVEIKGVKQGEHYSLAEVERLEDIGRSGKKIDAMTLSIMNLFKEIVDLSPHLPDELIDLAKNIEEPGPLADMIVSTLNLDRHKKQDILECLDVKTRLERITRFLSEDLELQKMGRQIQDQVKKGIDQHQKEFYLKEQLKAIQKELGMGDDEGSEIDELLERLEEKDLPEPVKAVAEKELRRLSGMNPASSEYTVSRTYLDWILDLPWNEGTEETLDIRRAERVLNRHHYNLEKVKKRILEYLAVRKLNPAHKGPILCLVGPPGTGKTSLGRSIAEAMGRKFVRTSLGGVRDEAEIRGHRRTYVGALPGRIIQGIKRAGSNNPVYILDEIDKVGTDFRGDPSSALLEVLDPEQNFSFSDHYLEVEFDLSKVMFIATANQLDPVPPPLRDRMEVLELAGYTEDEKLNIARKFLIPRQVKEHGLSREKIIIRTPAVRKIIREYTREAGVRNLEREIGAICRAVARGVAEGSEDLFDVSAAALQEYLGNPRFTFDLAKRTSVPGVAIGLAWTPAGGDILFVEATMMPGKKSLNLTGQLGDVMKESAHTAMSYLRSKAAQFGIREDFFAERDFHIHVPAGAIPKDGPSAGVTMLTALASLLIGRPVRHRVAMTGEVTLRGMVLPVGGIKEKVLAASRSGIKEIILPEGNRHDLDDIPEKIRKQLIFHLVNRMEDVLALALEEKKDETEKRSHEASTVKQASEEDGK